MIEKVIPHFDAATPILSPLGAANPIGSPSWTPIGAGDSGGGGQQMESPTKPSWGLPIAALFFVLVF